MSLNVQTAFRYKYLDFIFHFQYYGKEMSRAISFARLLKFIYEINK